ncbi:DUF7680 family protein [Streptomyces sp. S186]|uniref:DUF7680 family protein n=1 Tax=Streptomyces sp. S186 TaxID=3434395 RepID=UPI003F674E47
MSTVVRLVRPDASPGVRAFRLTVRSPEGSYTDGFAVTLEETYGRLASTVAQADAGQVQRALEAVVSAVRDSGHRPSVLAPHRRKPIQLEEEAGVRLALTLLAIAPLSRADRVHAVTSGIAGMSVEETYYWYALTTGASAQRARKALRVYLSGA